MQNYRYFLADMPSGSKNPNLSRRAFPGWVVRIATPVLKRLLPELRVPRAGDDALTVYASYMVGDFFMALPALEFLKKSAGQRPVRVVCRPDCVEFLTRAGIEAVPFSDPFRVRPGPGSFLRAWRAARALRGRLGDTVLDLDADPRTAFWLKVAGVRRTVSYRRASGSLFDVTFPLPEPSVHQADRDLRVVEEGLKRLGGPRAAGAGDSTGPAIRETDLSKKPSTAGSSPWIVSLWTRKPSKNWPLARWEALLERMEASGIAYRVLEAPDGDAAYRGFRARWSTRAAFLRGTLPEIAEAVRGGAGVIATDNFLGHMAGYYGKPVLWINQCSPAEQVMPRGPRTAAVTTPSVDEAWAAFETLKNAD